MPRRIYTYPRRAGWDLWNLVSTVGAFALGLGVLLFLVNALRSLRRGARAPADPWDGRTLEWRTSSPPPAPRLRRDPPDLRARHLLAGEVRRPARPPAGAARRAGGRRRTASTARAVACGRSRRPLGCWSRLAGALISLPVVVARGRLTVYGGLPVRPRSTTAIPRTRTRSACSASTCASSPCGRSSARSACSSAP